MWDRMKRVYTGSVGLGRILELLKKIDFMNEASKDWKFYISSRIPHINLKPYNQHDSEKRTIANYNCCYFKDTGNASCLTSGIDVLYF